MTLLLTIAVIVLLALIVSPLFRTRFQDRGRILALHALDPRFGDFSAVSMETFRSLLDECERLRIRIGTIEEALRREDTIAITFDDGYDDLIQIVPLLNERQIPVTVLMPTAFIGCENSWDNFLMRGRRRHLSAEQICQLSSAGVEFGAHTHSHVDLSRLNNADIVTELQKSKSVLEKMTGKQVRYVAYPFGCASKAVADVAQSLGYQAGFWSSPTAGDGFSFGRTPVSRFDTTLTIRAKLRPGILSGAEYLKCGIISRFSHLTPAVAGFREQHLSR